jgi:predicted metal-dependent phosphoesterase TrpH
MLVHPTHLRINAMDRLERVVETLQRMGLDGIEVWHPEIDKAKQLSLRALASKLGLLTCGGSDYHGTSKPHYLGDALTPWPAYQALRRAVKQRAANLSR